MGAKAGEDKEGGGERKGEGGGWGNALSPRSSDANGVAQGARFGDRPKGFPRTARPDHDYAARADEPIEDRLPNIDRLDLGEVVKWPRAAGPFLAAAKLEVRLLVALYQAAKDFVCC